MKLTTLLIFLILNSCQSQEPNNGFDNPNFNKDFNESKARKETTERENINPKQENDISKALQFTELRMGFNDVQRFELVISNAWDNDTNQNQTIHLYSFGKEVAGFDKDSCLIVNDSLATIKALFELAKYQMDQALETEKRSDKRYSDLWQWIQDRGLIPEENIIEQQKTKL